MLGERNQTHQPVHSLSKKGSHPSMKLHAPQQKIRSVTPTTRLHARARSLVHLIFLAVTCLLSATACRAIPPASPTAEEFVGPLAGWMDARRDFGAVGDGKADD